jgi:hypothetical protein
MCWFCEADESIAAASAASKRLKNFDQKLPFCAIEYLIKNKYIDVKEEIKIIIIINQTMYELVI